ncbi:hypothetical protein E5676_scaffold195G001060 [Cucumis melo var. makuwa]|uniref:Uncharacterized protein n=1 Tax=Cucumis melo var. makuwa TaxID=1194695 RepID=A0A5D3DGE0_CUCMM|nr:hypothetical protein E5676_scaffold195G001060 [Cucumis melo var. makuwa]
MRNGNSEHKILSKGPTTSPARCKRSKSKLAAQRQAKRLGGSRACRAARASAACVRLSYGLSAGAAWCGSCGRDSGQLHAEKKTWCAGRVPGRREKEEEETLATATRRSPPPPLRSRSAQVLPPVTRSAASPSIRVEPHRPSFFHYVWTPSPGSRRDHPFFVTVCRSSSQVKRMGSTGHRRGQPHQDVVSIQTRRPEPHCPAVLRLQSSVHHVKPSHQLPVIRAPPQVAHEEAEPLSSRARAAQTLRPRPKPDCLSVSPGFATDQYVLGAPSRHRRPDSVPTGAHVACVRKRRGGGKGKGKLAGDQK